MSKVEQQIRALAETARQYGGGMETPGEQAKALCGCVLCEADGPGGTGCQRAVSIASWLRQKTVELEALRMELRGVQVRYEEAIALLHELVVSQERHLRSMVELGKGCTCKPCRYLDGMIHEGED